MLFLSVLRTYVAITMVIRFVAVCIDEVTTAKKRSLALFSHSTTLYLLLLAYFGLAM